MTHDEKMEKYHDEIRKGWNCLVDADKLDLGRDEHDDMCIDGANHFVNAEEIIGDETSLQKVRWGLAMAYLMSNNIKLAIGEIDEAVKNVTIDSEKKIREVKLKMGIPRTVTQKDIDIFMDAVFDLQLKLGTFPVEGDVKSKFNSSIITEFYLLFLHVCAKNGIKSMRLYDGYRKKLHMERGSLEEFLNFLEEKFANDEVK